MGGGDNGYRIPLAPMLQQHIGPNWDYVGPLYTNGGKHAGCACLLIWNRRRPLPAQLPCYPRLPRRRLPLRPLGTTVVANI